MVFAFQIPTLFLNDTNVVLHNQDYKLQKLNNNKKTEFKSSISSVKNDAMDPLNGKVKMHMYKELQKEKVYKTKTLTPTGNTGKSEKIYNINNNKNKIMSLSSRNIDITNKNFKEMKANTAVYGIHGYIKNTAVKDFSEYVPLNEIIMLSETKMPLVNVAKRNYPDKECNPSRLIYGNLIETTSALCTINSIQTATKGAVVEYTSSKYFRPVESGDNNFNFKKHNLPVKPLKLIAPRKINDVYFIKTLQENPENHYKQCNRQEDLEIHNIFSSNVDEKYPTKNGLTKHDARPVNQYHHESLAKGCNTERGSPKIIIERAVEDDLQNSNINKFKINIEKYRENKYPDKGNESIDTNVINGKDTENQIEYNTQNRKPPISDHTLEGSSHIKMEDDNNEDLNQSNESIDCLKLHEKATALKEEINYKNYESNVQNKKVNDIEELVNGSVYNPTNFELFKARKPFKNIRDGCTETFEEIDFEYSLEKMDQNSVTDKRLSKHIAKPASQLYENRTKIENFIETEDSRNILEEGVENSLQNNGVSKDNNGIEKVEIYGKYDKSYKDNKDIDVFQLNSSLDDSTDYFNKISESFDEEYNEILPNLDYMKDIELEKEKPTDRDLKETKDALLLQSAGTLQNTGITDIKEYEETSNIHITNFTISEVMNTLVSSVCDNIINEESDNKYEIERTAFSPGISSDNDIPKLNNTNVKLCLSTKFADDVITSREQLDNLEKHKTSYKQIYKESEGESNTETAGGNLANQNVNRNGECSSKMTSRSILPDAEKSPHLNSVHNDINNLIYDNALCSKSLFNSTGTIIDPQSENIIHKKNYEAGNRSSHCCDSRINVSSNIESICDIMQQYDDEDFKKREDVLLLQNTTSTKMKKPEGTSNSHTSHVSTTGILEPHEVSKCDDAVGEEKVSSDEVKKMRLSPVNSAVSKTSVVTNKPHLNACLNINFSQDVKYSLDQLDNKENHSTVHSKSNKVFEGKGNPGIVDTSLTRHNLDENKECSSESFFCITFPDTENIFQENSTEDIANSSNLKQQRYEDLIYNENPRGSTKMMNTPLSKKIISEKNCDGGNILNNCYDSIANASDNIGNIRGKTEQRSSEDFKDKNDVLPLQNMTTANICDNIIDKEMHKIDNDEMLSGYEDIETANINLKNHNTDCNEKCIPESTLFRTLPDAEKRHQANSINSNVSSSNSKQQQYEDRVHSKDLCDGTKTIDDALSKKTIYDKKYVFENRSNHFCDSHDSSFDGIENIHDNKKEEHFNRDLKDRKDAPLLRIMTIADTEDFENSPNFSITKENVTDVSKPLEINVFNDINGEEIVCKQEIKKICLPPKKVSDSNTSRDHYKTCLKSCLSAKSVQTVIEFHEQLSKAEKHKAVHDQLHNGSINKGTVEFANTSLTRHCVDDNQKHTSKDTRCSILSGAEEILLINSMDNEVNSSIFTQEHYEDLVYEKNPCDGTKIMNNTLSKKIIHEKHHDDDDNTLNNCCLSHADALGNTRKIRDKIADYCDEDLGTGKLELLRQSIISAEFNDFNDSSTLYTTNLNREVLKPTESNVPHDIKEEMLDKNENDQIPSFPGKSSDSNALRLYDKTNLEECPSTELSETVIESQEQLNNREKHNIVQEVECKSNEQISHKSPMKQNADANEKYYSYDALYNTLYEGGICFLVNSMNGDVNKSKIKQSQYGELLYSKDLCNGISKRTGSLSKKVSNEKNCDISSTYKLYYNHHVISSPDNIDNLCDKIEGHIHNVEISPKYENLNEESRVVCYTNVIEEDLEWEDMSTNFACPEFKHEKLETADKAAQNEKSKVIDKLKRLDKCKLRNINSNLEIFSTTGNNKFNSVNSSSEICNVENTGKCDHEKTYYKERSHLNDNINFEDMERFQTEINPSSHLYKTDEDATDDEDEIDKDTALNKQFELQEKAQNIKKINDGWLNAAEETAEKNTACQNNEQPMTDIFETNINENNQFIETNNITVLSKQRTVDNFSGDKVVCLLQETDSHPKRNCSEARFQSNEKSEIISKEISKHVGKNVSGKKFKRQSNFIEEEYIGNERLIQESLDINQWLMAHPDIDEIIDASEKEICPQSDRNTGKSTSPDKFYNVHNKSINSSLKLKDAATESQTFDSVDSPSKKLELKKSSSGDYSDLMNLANDFCSFNKICPKIYENDKVFHTNGPKEITDKYSKFTKNSFPSSLDAFDTNQSDLDDDVFLEEVLYDHYKRNCEEENFNYGNNRSGLKTTVEKRTDSFASENESVDAACNDIVHGILSPPHNEFKWIFDINLNDSGFASLNSSYNKLEELNKHHPEHVNHTLKMVVERDDVAQNSKLLPELERKGSCVTHQTKEAVVLKNYPQKIVLQNFTNTNTALHNIGQCSRNPTEINNNLNNIFTETSHMDKYAASWLQFKPLLKDGNAGNVSVLYGSTSKTKYTQTDASITDKVKFLDVQYTANLVPTTCSEPMQSNLEKLPIGITQSISDCYFNKFVEKIFEDIMQSITTGITYNMSNKRYNAISKELSATNSFFFSQEASPTIHKEKYVDNSCASCDSTTQVIIDNMRHDSTNITSSGNTSDQKLREQANMFSFSLDKLSNHSVILTLDPRKNYEQIHCSGKSQENRKRNRNSFILLERYAEDLLYNIISVLFSSIKREMEGNERLNITKKLEYPGKERCVKNNSRCQISIQTPLTKNLFLKTGNAQEKKLAWADNRNLEPTVTGNAIMKNLANESCSDNRSCTRIELKLIKDPLLDIELPGHLLNEEKNVIQDTSHKNDEKQYLLFDKASPRDCKSQLLSRERLDSSQTKVDQFHCNDFKVNIDVRSDTPTSSVIASDREQCDSNISSRKRKCDNFNQTIHELNNSDGKYDFSNDLHDAINDRVEVNTACSPKNDELEYPSINDNSKYSKLFLKTPREDKERNDRVETSKTHNNDNDQIQEETDTFFYNNINPIEMVKSVTKIRRNSEGNAVSSQNKYLSKDGISMEDPYDENMYQSCGMNNILFYFFDHYVQMAGMV